MASGGFISSCLFGVVGFKNMKVFKQATLPPTKTGSSAVERLKWTQNLWTLVRGQKPTLDDAGQPINLCPQDPMIVERFLTMFRSIFGSGLVVFSSGESVGWVAPVCLKMGVNCVCTEPDQVAFHYLHYGLLTREGNILLQKGKQERLETYQCFCSFFEERKR